MSSIISNTSSFDLDSVCLKQILCESTIATGRKLCCNVYLKMPEKNQKRIGHSLSLTGRWFIAFVWRGIFLFFPSDPTTPIGWLDLASPPFGKKGGGFIQVKKHFSFQQAFQHLLLFCRGKREAKRERTGFVILIPRCSFQLSPAWG